MNSKFKVTIPKPCHENWNTMSPKEKGRFCNSCSKTVVDFTKRSTTEIQDYLVENKSERVCGHFYKKQLDTITIEIPDATFYQQLSFQKTFILALLFVMGTTLFSCQYDNGKKQKIQDIIIVDTIKKVDSLTIFNPKDSIFEPIIMGEMPINIIEGMITTEGEIALEEDVCNWGVISKPPRFKEAKKLSKEKAKEDFDERIKKFVQANFDDKITQCLDLPIGKHKIYTQFTIDKRGNIVDIKVRAPHTKLKDEITKVLQKLPQFIPGKQRNKVVKTKYTLPFAFQVE